MSARLGVDTIRSVVMGAILGAIAWAICARAGWSPWPNCAYAAAVGTYLGVFGPLRVLAACGSGAVFAGIGWGIGWLLAFKAGWANPSAPLYGGLIGTYFGVCCGSLREKPRAKEDRGLADALPLAALNAGAGALVAAGVAWGIARLFGWDAGTAVHWGGAIGAALGFLSGWAVGLADAPAPVSVSTSARNEGGVLGRALSVLSGKSCGACGRGVSLSAHAGQRCPHCGAYWGGERTIHKYG